MIHIAIVEDEESYVRQLLEYIERFQQEHFQEIKTSIFRDGDEILEKYSADYDIILMDIQMQFVDGMTAAEKIREMDKSVILMFITNMTSYAVKGYEVDALDYMVKPVEYFSFSQKLSRAMSRVKRKEERYILVPVETGVQKINIEELYYIESFGHQLIYVTKRGRYSSRGVMKKMEEKLVPYGFYRSGKSYLVNMKYVEGTPEGSCLIHNESLQISRQKRKEFMEVLLNYMSEVAQ